MSRCFYASYASDIFVQQLSRVRVKAANDDKLPERVVRLMKDPRCNSDDESGVEEDGTLIYAINQKTPRSVSATSFIRSVDAKRLKFTRGKKGKKHERTRMVVPNPNETEMSFQLPDAVPIDWFDPAYFNDLPAKTRFDYSKNGVALPLPQHHQNKDWKTMDKNTFMQKYGNDVLQLYDIPTSDEMEGKGNDGWASEEEADDEEMMDD